MTESNLTEKVLTAKRPCPYCDGKDWHTLETLMPATKGRLHRFENLGMDMKLILRVCKICNYVQMFNASPLENQ